MSFETFVETSLDHVPPEFERNFNLIRELDQRSKDLIPRINDIMKLYKQTRNKNDRQALRKEVTMLMDKILSYADDKVELAEQTYELVDKNIKQLISIGNPHDSDSDGSHQMLGCDMPLDPNEPKYCICRGVSYGEMIACDNKDCLIEWFHLACIGMTSAPKGKWYCNECYRPPNKKQKTRLRKSGHNVTM